MYQSINKEGFIALKLQRTDARKQEVASFSSQAEGQSALFKITDKYVLCQKINHLENVKTHCFPFEMNECNGACIGQEDPEDYNERVEEFLQNNEYQNQNIIIIEKGRNMHERSAVLIENGVLKGYAFYDLNYQVTNTEVLKNILIAIPNNRDSKNTALAYIKKSKQAKIIHF